MRCPCIHSINCIISFIVQYSQVVDDFHPVLLYFVLQIVDHKGNTDYFNITQSDYACVPVTQGKKYNISLSGVNYIGESEDNPTKTIGMFQDNVVVLKTQYSNISNCIFKK